MRIDMMNAVIGVGAGALDEVLERVDEDQGRTEPFKGYRDWVRVGVAAACYLGQAFNYFPRVVAPLAQSEIPLVTKSVAKIIIGTGVTRRVSRPRERVREPSISGSRVAWRPQAIGY